jgi:hypothetical protein
MDVRWLRSRYPRHRRQNQAVGVLEEEWDEAHREFTTGPHPANLYTLDLDTIPQLRVGDPEFRDSGAVMVAASERYPVTRYSDSNYGSRIDVNAEGEHAIVAPGEWDRYPGGSGTLPPMSQIHAWYTAEFGDTSAASAQVAGALAHLNSIATSYSLTGHPLRGSRAARTLRGDG